MIDPRPSSGGAPRKRSNNNDDNDDVLLLERLRAFQEKDHSLRVSASSIAAMAGFHPYKCLPQLLMDLVYQGSVGRALLRHDCALLGLKQQSEDEVLLVLAQKAGQSTAQALQAALQVKRGHKKLHNNQDATTVKQLVLKEAQQSKKLSAAELKLLEEGVRHSVNTGFGTFHEDEALNLYEKQCGWQVSGRNEEIMCWPFGKSEDAAGVDSSPMEEGSCSQPTVVPLGTASKLYDLFPRETSSTGDDQKGEEKSESDPSGRKRVKQNADIPSPSGTDLSRIENDGGCDGGCDREDTTCNNNQETIPQNQPKDGSFPPQQTRIKRAPFFNILGAVDGVREELWCPPPTSKKDNIASNADPASDNTANGVLVDDCWTLRSIIVECKHRMSRARVPPPLYDQIQTAAYCLMYRVDEADLVQVVRKQMEKPKKQKKVSSSKANKKRNSNNEQIIMKEANSQNSSKGYYLSSEKENETSNSEGTKRTKKDLNSNTESSARDKSTKSAKLSTIENGENEEAATTFAKKQEEEDKTKHCTKIDILVSRISLDDPLMQHRKNWYEVVLPRLRSFVDAVYSVRRDDQRRYQLLVSLAPTATNLNSDEAAVELEAWNLLHEECPWLKDCDTAFRNNINLR